MFQFPRSHRISRSASKTAAFLLTLITMSGCRLEAEPGPLHHDPSLGYLEREVSSALEELETLTCAQQDATQHGASESAQRALLKLRDYYVPLLEALLRADRASQWLQDGEDDLALEDLTRIEGKLLAISDHGDSKLSREMDQPLELVVAARAAIRSHRAEAPDLLHDLRTRIHQLLHKGELVLRGTYLQPR